jgi:hypothetical protein
MHFCRDNRRVPGAAGVGVGCTVLQGRTSRANQSYFLKNLPTTLITNLNELQILVRAINQKVDQLRDEYDRSIDNSLVPEHAHL